MLESMGLEIMQRVAHQCMCMYVCMYVCVCACVCMTFMVPFLRIVHGLYHSLRQSSYQLVDQRKSFDFFVPIVVTST